MANRELMEIVVLRLINLMEIAVLRLINPRHACTSVTVLGLSVCQSAHLSVASLQIALACIGELQLSQL